MAYDPTFPVDNTLIEAAPFRTQFQSLKDLADLALAGGVTAAQVDGVNTTDPANPALASVVLDGGTLRFTFTLPRGMEGQQGIPGNNGNDGGPGPQGPQGPPFAQAIIDAVNTLPPGSAATVGVMFDGSNVRFTFSIPRGADGPPGEVTTAALDTAIAGTSANTNAVTTLDTAFADPDTEALRQKVNELVLNGRR